jgi:hypothetical protein
MDHTAANAHLAEFGRELVAELAPHELDVFPLVCDAYFRDPAGVERARGRRDDILGAGIEPGVVFLTPVVLAVLSEIVRFLGEQLRKVLAEEATKAIRAVLNRLLGRQVNDTPAPGPEPRLPDDLVRRVHDLVLTVARKLQLPEREARLLADTVVAHLILGEVRQARHDRGGVP